MRAQRNTRQRKMVLDAVRSRYDHPTAEELYNAVRMQDPKISRGTLYRNLGQLVQNGDIAQIRIPEASHFDLRTDAHYHMVCTVCGRVSDVPVPYQTALDRAVEEAAGLTGIHHMTLFEGICPDCRMDNTAQKK